MSPAESDRGRLIAPDLDDRRWQDLVAETTALIDRYAPQWTDRSPSDLGITLVELFAWLVEGLIYKLNRVPEKNYVAFLNLLGILREPATPARTLLTFTPLPGQSATVPAGSLAQTEGSESVAPVVFQTEAPLLLVPATVEIAMLRGGQSCVDISRTFLPPESSGASVTLAPNETASILLGFDVGFAGVELEVYAELGGRTEGATVSASWVYSSGSLDPTGWPALTVVDDSSSGLTRAGKVRLRPSDKPWSTQDTTTWSIRPPAPTKTRRWIGLRLTNTTPRAADGGTDRISVEVKHVLLNTVAASTALLAGRVAPEDLGLAGGTRQTFALRGRPVYAIPVSGSPYAHVRVTVDGTEWTMAASSATGPGRFYRLDPVTGEITFGVSPDWELPAAGLRVTASYRYVAASSAGNVIRGAVTTLAEGIANVIAVSNPVPGTGGVDEEPIEQTKARAPTLLRTRDRAVTAEDYEFLTRQAASEIVIVRCLPPRVHDDHTPWTYATLQRAPGNVNVIIVPDLGRDEPRPEPSIAHIHQVLSALDSRRDVTALLKVTGPRYLPINVRVEAILFQRAVDQGLIPSAHAEYAAISARVERFLHPVHGGPGGHGWQVGQSIYLADIYRAIKPDDRVGYIADLGLTPGTPLYHDVTTGPFTQAERPFALPTGKASHVRVADYELICFGEADVPPLDLE
ncbi:baseplate J/gp47 family protein [Actinocrispum sp. NPDC049592]|uniref:baseplate J/gp47 family protein n=1 Tax=Actinocrispum sp. NPDC049592 TaxID=3154835 RepID=UPI003412FF57